MQNLYQRPGDYDHFRVEQPAPLLDWLLQNVHPRGWRGGDAV